MDSRIGGFHELCRGSDLPALIEYVKLHNITAEDARSEENYALRWACLNDQLDIAMWLAKYFNLTAEDARSWNNHTLRWACLNGYFDIAQWLIEYFGFTREDICDRVRKEIMDQLDWEPALGPKSAVKFT